MIDLHVHSTFSDGSYTPSELVAYAIKKGLTAFALTDHDTTAGIPYALEAARHTDLKLLSGIELSTIHNGADIHMLGLSIDYQNSAFQKELERLRERRYSRNILMIQAFNQQGFPVTERLLKERFPDSIITRAHFALWLFENGYVSSKDAAFKKYLNPGCPCYIPKQGITPIEAITLIHTHGKGKAVLAHPLLYRMSNVQLESFVKELAENGLDGIEAIYSCNHGSDTAKMKQLARKYHLFITGGSDFHGAAKPDLELGTGYGHLCVPDELLHFL